MKSLKENALLYFNPDGDLIMDLSKEGNHPVIINQAKLYLLAWLKMARKKGKKGKMTLLEIVTDYIASLKRNQQE